VKRSDRCFERTLADGVCAYLAMKSGVGQEIRRIIQKPKQF
jgi:hypothetical protein